MLLSSRYFLNQPVQSYCCVVFTLYVLFTREIIVAVGLMLRRETLHV